MRKKQTDSEKRAEEKRIRKSLIYLRFKTLMVRHDYSIDQLKALDTFIDNMSGYGYEWYAKYASKAIELLQEDIFETHM